MRLKSKEIIVKLWFFPSNLNLKLISKEEKEWSSSLPEKRKQEYRYSRCYTRLALAQLFDMDPLSIPLFSEPGKPPSLYKIVDLIV